MLKKLIPSHLFALRVEGQFVSPADQQRHFVIGLAREPCSGFVSLWAYGSQGKGQFRQEFQKHAGKAQVREWYGQTPPFNSSEDVARFREWMRLPAVRGVVTARFLTHYSSQPAVDCWVLTDRLAETLKVCLRRYEMQGGVVNHTQDEAAWGIASSTHSRASSHGACREYYDAALAVEVERGFDANLFTAFKWPGCCSVSSTSKDTTSAGSSSSNSGGGDDGGSSDVGHGSGSGVSIDAGARSISLGGGNTQVLAARPRQLYGQPHFIHIPKAAGETVEQLVHTQPPGTANMHPTTRFYYVRHLIFGKNVTLGMEQRRSALGE